MVCGSDYDSNSGLQLRTPIGEKRQQNLRRTRVAAVAVLSSISLDKPKELEFFWLRLSEKWHLRRTHVAAAVWTRVWQCHSATKYCGWEESPIWQRVIL